MPGHGARDGRDVCGTHDAHHCLIAPLDASSVPRTLIDHEPEGSTEAVCALRGHHAREAAKCIVPRVEVDARHVGFSDAETAERLARTIPGTVLPFSFEPELEVVADPDVVAQPRLYFNAARLDRSLCISDADYERLAEPRAEPIASPLPD
jgi:Ala-tRNA(Pro) deacylase